MLINLYKDSKEPIYLQIANQIKKEIMNKNLKADDLLPSIRALATDLKVSVITTKRAYMELETQGFIQTVAGKGTYVTNKTVNVIEDEYFKSIEKSIENIYNCADALGISKEDIIKMFEKRRK
ncbi:MAG: GntR family transcriptional regulator [Parvimonas sp.]|uniref:GntR family transcriptional regulator n=1 Tax=Parvimonas sp. TaxID=1944660 RepID=UPI0025F9636A|nr:GntR family transcriptional regulator [Parvimonas sp.]MCI5997737.1 GntR family transcriptional regulator [Parvimonas sp.]MDY3051167.1 GntR family transcriptional regulator [Parvimonas sp.]